MFTPKNLFLTLCSLVSSTNENGYDTAILNALASEIGNVKLPGRSALSQFRKRIDYNFFKDEVETLNKKSVSKRKMWRGLYLYAIDGIQLTLPRTKDIIAENYSGRKVSKYRESYMPKMFAVGAVDVINGIVKEFREHPTLNEIADALDIIPKLEVKSLTIYDRLYGSKKMVVTHSEAGNHFLFRLRKSVCKEMKVIFKSKRKRMSVTVEGAAVQLIKVFNPTTRAYDHFATSLSKKQINQKVIRQLYNLRWEIENTFRDFTKTIRLEQWHSKFINGIRQELWVAIWLYNFVKMKILDHHNPAKDCMEIVYKKPNFKLIFGWITSNLPKIFKRYRGFKKMLVELIYRSMEKRKRHSRSYKREIKSPRSPFPYNNTRWYGLN